MKCPKCSGYMLYISFYEFTGHRCLNCGKIISYDPPRETNELERFLYIRPKDIATPVANAGYTKKYNLSSKECIRCGKTFTAILSGSPRSHRFCDYQCRRLTYYDELKEKRKIDKLKRSKSLPI